MELTGSLSAEQHAKLMEIAEKCPVHRTLTSEINIRLRPVRNRLQHDRRCRRFNDVGWKIFKYARTSNITR